MKTTIIRFFITKNNFFDRERLVALNEESLFKLLLTKSYKLMLRACKQKNFKTKPKKNDLERIGDCLSVIGFKSKIKALFRKKKRSFKPVRTLTLILN